MAVFTDLPDDILLEILAYFEHTKRDLLRLSKTCRRLLAPSRNYIYRTVDIFVYSTLKELHGTYKRSGNPMPDDRSITLLLRSIRENRYLGPLVKSLYVSWNPSWVKSPKKFREVSELFSALPNLRRLEISDKRVEGRITFRGIDKECFPDHVTWILQECSSLPLQSYVLNLAQLSSTRLASVMILPTVESVTAPCFYDVGRGTGPSTALNDNLRVFNATRLSAPSALTYLDLGSCRISLPALEGILNFAPKLQRLKLTLPGRSSRRVDPNFGLTESDRLLNPSAVARALRPVKHTLEQLDMVNDRHSWKGTDETRADFTTFKMLRKMRVAPGLFFKWGAFGYGEHMNIDHGFTADMEDRRGLPGLLPPNLEELEIYFQFDAGIFCVSNIHVAKLEAMTYMAPDHYHWIQELATYKTQTLPHLRSVRLIEQLFTGSVQGEGISFEEMNWKPPQELLDSYADAGVELKIQLRSNHRQKVAEMKACCAVASAYGRTCCTGLN